ncbi:MAG: DUF3558 domain-containing protein [Actinophytocola sp.]|nr:DUF3558 domain-containing protein [Actinophytocola sp.]
MTKRITTVAASLITVGLLAGCSTDEAGAPTPSQKTSASQSPSAAELPHSGAPAVTSTVDTGKWEGKPCDALTSSQLSSNRLNSVEAEPDLQSMNGPQCSWYSPNTGSFGGAFLTKTPTGEPPQGLSAGYANNKKNPFAIWQEVTIEGQPAVIANEKDQRNRGECGVAVGLRDDLAYSVRITDPDKDFANDPCAFAKKIATLAVTTMKGGS